MDNVKSVCGRCNKRILSHSKILTCSLCSKKNHYKCIPLTRREFEYMIIYAGDWYCTYCNEEIFPYNCIDNDSEFMETLFAMYSDNTLDFEYIENMVFNPFSFNDNMKIPFFDTDPDVNFYSEMSYINLRSSNYLTEDQFIEKYSSKKNNLSLLHWNIRSFPCHKLE